MAFQLAAARRDSPNRPAWSGMAVVVEAMVLLLFLVGSLAIVTQLFASSALRAREGQQLAAADAAATNAAERFSADPAAADGVTTEGDLEVACAVTDEALASGTLYHATITVLADDAEPPLYVLETSRYVQEVS